MGSAPGTARGGTSGLCTCAPAGSADIAGPWVSCSYHSVLSALPPAPACRSGAPMPPPVVLPPSLMFSPTPCCPLLPSHFRYRYPGIAARCDPLLPEALVLPHSFLPSHFRYICIPARALLAALREPAGIVLVRRDRQAVGHGGAAATGKQACFSDISVPLCLPPSLTAGAQLGAPS